MSYLWLYVILTMQTIYVPGTMVVAIGILLSDLDHLEGGRVIVG